MTASIQPKEVLGLAGHAKLNIHRDPGFPVHSYAGQAWPVLADDKKQLQCFEYWDL